MKSFPGLLMAGVVLTLTIHAKGETKDSHILHMLPKTTATVPLFTVLSFYVKYIFTVRWTPVTMTGLKIIRTPYSQRDTHRKKSLSRGYKHLVKRHFFHA